MIYFLQHADGYGPIKIGHSVDVDTRRKQLEARYGIPLAVLGTMPGGRKTERELHERFSCLRIGRTEHFEPGSDLVEFVETESEPWDPSLDRSTAVVKLPAGIVSSARLVADLRGMSVSDIISDMIRDDIEAMRREAILDHARALGFH